MNFSSCEFVPGDSLYQWLGVPQTRLCYSMDWSTGIFVGKPRNDGSHMAMAYEPPYAHGMARKTQSYFSNSEYQTKMLKIFAGISLIQGAFFALVGWGLVTKVKNTAFQSGLSNDHPFFQSFATQETTIYLMIIAAVTISTLVFSWLGLQWTHDAVGAIYHLKKDLEKMATTKSLYRVKLRKNDYFKEFEESFNNMVEAVSPHADFEAGDDIDQYTPTPTPNLDSFKKESH